jgi:hypothetical protein
MQRLIVLLVCASMMSGGCAARASGRRISDATSVPQNSQDPQRAAVDTSLMRDYIRQLAVGSKVRLVQKDGDVIRAILMKNDADPIVIQRRTRIPEAPVEIAIRDIAAVELETNSGSTGRSIAIGAAAAVGATLGVLMLLAAIFAD